MARKQLQNLTEPMYYILLSLVEPKHGYGIMKQVEKTTDGRVKVGAGTLYSLLSRFEKEEIVCQIGSDGTKKIYKLTSKGMDILAAEHQRLKQLVDDGINILGGQEDE